MDWIVTNLPVVLCTVIGVALLLLEAFMPGFGAPGICGIILSIASVVITGFRYGAGPAALLALGLAAFIALAVTLSLRSAVKGRLSRSPLILRNQEQGEAEEDMSGWVGREGTALTALRPVGIMEAEGRRLDVQTEGDFIPAGSPVRVIRTEGRRLIVAAKAQ